MVLVAFVVAKPWKLAKCVWARMHCPGGWGKLLSKAPSVSLGHAMITDLTPRAGGAGGPGSGAVAHRYNRSRAGSNTRAALQLL